MKRNEKVLFGLIISFIMMFVLTACGENSNAVNKEVQSNITKQDNVSKDNINEDIKYDKENNVNNDDNKDEVTKDEINKDNKQNQSQANDVNKGNNINKNSSIQSSTPSVSNEQTNTQNNTPTQSNAQQATNTPSPQESTQKPKPAPQPPKPQQNVDSPKKAYLTIECKTILNNMKDLTPGKEGLIPSDGYILHKTMVTFKDGESVFDVLLRVTREKGIHMEYKYTPGYGSHYIEGINNLYEFDCGRGSGWMYYVNGVKPNYGVSKYLLKDGDDISFRYTCDLGNDL